MPSSSQIAASSRRRREEGAERLHFGAFRFDPRTLELQRSGRPVPLPPLPARVLALLLERPGTLVTRSELAEAVWGPGVFVDAEAGLNTAVRQVRRALGDSATAPRFVETVPRRGYRFVAPLHEANGDPPRRRPLPAALAIALAAALVVLGATGVAWLRDLDSPTASPAARPPAVTIAVEAAAERELQLLALSIADLLRAQLAERPGRIRVAADGESGGRSHRLTLRAEPAEWPGHARLRASLSRPDTTGANGAAGGAPATLPLLDSTVSLDTFAAVRDDVSRRLARHLEVSLGAASTGVGTSEPQAWLLYLEAHSGMEELACDGEGPTTLLERSVELDPEFVSGWYLLAGARFLHGNLCSGGPADYAAAAAAARRAAELAPGWADPVQLEAGIELHRGRTEEAMRRMSEALRRFPDEPFVLLRTSEVLRYAGLLEESTRLFERVLDDDPAQVLQTDMVAYPYLYSGEWRRFLELLPARTGPFFRYYRGWAQLQLGDREAARQALSPAFVEHPGDAFGRLSQALLAILDGHRDEARVTLEQLAHQRRARQVGDGEMTFKIGLLTVLAGEPERGLELLELAVGQGFFCPACLEGGGLAERLGGAPRYEALLATARQRQDAFVRSFPAAALPAGGSPAASS